MDIATVLFQLTLVGLALCLAIQVGLDAIGERTPAVGTTSTRRRSMRPSVPAASRVSAAKARARNPFSTAQMSR